MSTTPLPDEPEHDPMLRAALRHAPDRDARPPAAVSAHILQRAQQAVAPVAAPSGASRGGGWRTAARWLGALTRPVPAAAFASLMLATVIGVMWRGGPPPEDRQEAPTTVVPPEPPRLTTGPGTNGRDTSSGAAADSAGASPARPAEAAPTRGADAPPAPPTPSPSARSLPPPQAKAAAQGPTPAASLPQAFTQRELRSEEAKASDEARAPAPADRNAALTGRTDDEARRSPSPPGTPSAAEAGAAREPERAAPAPAAPQAAAAGRGETARERGDSTTASRSMLAATPDPLAALADGWVAPAAQRAALDELRRLSAGRWTRVPAPDLPPPLELNRADGRALGRLAITDDAVLWLPGGADGPAWRAPLEPAAASDLRRRLALPAGR